MYLVTEYSRDCTEDGRNIYKRISKPGKHVAILSMNKRIKMGMFTSLASQCIGSRILTISYKTL